MIIFRMLLKAFVYYFNDDKVATAYGGLDFLWFCCVLNNVENNLTESKLLVFSLLSSWQETWSWNKHFRSSKGKPFPFLDVPQRVVPASTVDVSCPWGWAATEKAVHK